MYDQPNDLDQRVGQLDQSVERLTTEVASLKLELATLVSALRDSQRQRPPSGMRIPVAKVTKPPAAPVRPSITPAAVVVLLAVALLAWQLIVTPRNERISAQTSRPHTAAATTPRIELPIEPTRSTEPPVTPLVRPTIYTGTLSVRSDAPRATVFVNRRNVGTAPVRVSHLKAGAHLVWVESEGFKRWTRVVTVPAERVTRVTAALEPEPIER